MIAPTFIMSMDAFLVEKRPYARILAVLLREGELSATRFKICSNVNYLTDRIDELIEYGLVEFHFSTEGRTMKFYRLTEKGVMVACMIRYIEDLRVERGTVSFEDMVAELDRRLSVCSEKLKKTEQL